MMERPRLQALRDRLQREGMRQPTSQRTIPKAPTIQKPMTEQNPIIPPMTPSKPLITRVSAAVVNDNDEDENTKHHNTLIDRFGRKHTYLRISLTERCNLRCTYCMPEQGLPELPSHVLTTKEVLEIAEYFADRGVNKFRLTGGEPTLRRDLVEIVTGLKQYAPTIGMTTNGIALNARKLQQLETAGLTHLNVSMDTLDTDQFTKITRRPYFSKVYKTLDAALTETNLKIKLNCVVQRNVNEDQVVNFVRLLKEYPQLQIRFIEYMPFADNAWSYDQCVPYRELVELIRTAGISLQKIVSDDPNDTTKWYREELTGGKIGFISSMSQHFCASCNRLRVTADGLLKVCLFDTELSTVDLKTAMGQGIPLDAIVGPAIQRKHKALGGHANPISLGESSAENRPMTRIGG